MPYRVEGIAKRRKLDNVRDQGVIMVNNNMRLLEEVRKGCDNNMLHDVEEVPPRFEESAGCRNASKERSLRGIYEGIVKKTHKKVGGIFFGENFCSWLIVIQQWNIFLS